MIAPYYQDDAVTIYHGDCREVLPSLTFDVVVTDPPYGIGLDTDYASMSNSSGSIRRQYKPIEGDGDPFDPAPLLASPCLLFGANSFASKLPDSGTWHVWDKRVTAASNLFADFEVWWTSWRSAPSRILRYQWLCGVHPGSPTQRWIEHPTVKPVPVMAHVLTQAPAGVVCDPYMGSGSTLRAAKDLGRKAIGIEVEERYCEIAAKRMAQEVLDFGAAS